MPLREQAGERLDDVDLAGALHGAHVEAGIEQMQNGMLDAADILIDRHPIADGVVIDRPLGIGGAEAGEVPGGIDEGVEGVGLALGRAAALRAGDVLPGRVVGERVAGLIEGDILGQGDRQVALGHRHDAAARAMDDRDRAAPVALARHAPVAQAVIDGALADPQRLGAGGDLLLGRGDGHAVEEVGIDHHGIAALAYRGRRHRRSRSCCRIGARAARPPV